MTMIVIVFESKTIFILSSIIINNYRPLYKLGEVEMDWVDTKTYLGGCNAVKP